MKDRFPTLSTACYTLLVLCALLPAGCRGSRPTQLMVVGGAGMNGGGNAAVVRIYHLSSDNNFQRATPESFWRSDEEALGTELIAPKQEVLLYPDQERSFEFEIGEEVRYVGVAADLRNPSQNQWRQIFAAEELRGKTITVTVGDDRLMVAAN